MPPFYYDCPICKKKHQQGQLGKHILRYSQAELYNYVSNLDKITTTGAHPEILCSGRTYVLCPKSNTAYEKVGGKLEKNHSNCAHKYYEFAIAPNSQKEHDQEQPKQELDKEQEPAPPTNEYTSQNKDKLISLCKLKGIIGYSGKKHNALVDLLIDHDVKTKAVPPESICYINLDEHTVPIKQTCDCSKHIELLQKELDLYKAWAKSIIVTMPSQQIATIANTIDMPPVHNDVQIKKPELHNPVQIKKPIAKVTKLVKKPITKVKASKKEIEKGLWCTKCESCHNTAQFATDLKPCQVCNKQCHKDSDLYGCYHWDCAVCDKKICKECNKAAGGNKLFSFCSITCKKQHAS